MYLVVVRTKFMQYTFSQNCVRVFKDNAPGDMKKFCRCATAINLYFKNCYQDQSHTLGIVEWHGDLNDLMFYRLSDPQNIIYSVHELSTTAMVAYDKLKVIYGKRNYKLFQDNFLAERLQYKAMYDIIMQDMKFE